MYRKCYDSGPGSIHKTELFRSQVPTPMSPFANTWRGVAISLQTTLGGKRSTVRVITIDLCAIPMKPTSKRFRLRGLLAM